MINANFRQDYLNDFLMDMVDWPLPFYPNTQTFMVEPRVVDGTIAS